MEPQKWKKIMVKNPLVELDGDEMAHVIWNLVKHKLILPYLDINLRSFNLSLENRNDSNDEVTHQALKAIHEFKVAIKCATISPDEARMREFHLKQMWVSPNATIRRELKGTIFREPIIIKNVHRYIPHWDKPIIVCRQAFGDHYDGVEMKLNSHTTAALSLTDHASGQTTAHDVTNFSDHGGVLMGCFNSKENIEQFAGACFQLAVERKMPLFLSTKSTIMKTYDGFIVEVFQRVHDEQFAAAFAAAGIFYEHRLIADMAAYLIKNNGGYVWACKNADGDIFSGLVSQGFGSLGLMTSELHAPNGVFISDHAHGTITRHFRDHQKGLPTSTNPAAIIFAWSRGLKRRGLIDENAELVDFANKVEQATVETVESGIATKDLLALIHPQSPVARQPHVTTEEFIEHVEHRLKDLVNPIAFV